MSLTVPKGIKVIILEGIPGAGKTTLHNQLKELLVGKTIYDYHEESLLWSWMHSWIPGIYPLRLELMERMLDYVDVVTQEDPGSVFIFNRFHISYALLADEKDDARLTAVINRLRGAGAHIYVPLVSIEEVEARASHKERQDPLWESHLKKRLAQKDFSNLTDMYMNDQKLIQEMLESHDIPYTTLNVDAPNGKN